MRLTTGWNWSIVVLTMVLGASCSNGGDNGGVKTKAKKPAQAVEKNKNKNKLSSDNAAEFFSAYAKQNPEDIVEIQTDFGSIKIKLYEDTPLHRANFIYLSRKGYFDKTWFHRVSRGHVIQGGNSDSQLTSKARSKIGTYRLPNEINNHHFHKRGAVATARSYRNNKLKESNPYEFYISLGTIYSKQQLNLMEETYDTKFNSQQREIYTSIGGSPHLDYEHTVFGEVIEGMDVVEKINEVEVDSGEWPLINIPIRVKVL